MQLLTLYLIANFEDHDVACIYPHFDGTHLKIPTAQSSCVELTNIEADRRRHASYHRSSEDENMIPDLPFALTKDSIINRYLGIFGDAESAPGRMTSLVALDQFQYHNETITYDSGWNVHPL